MRACRPEGRRRTSGDSPWGNVWKKADKMTFWRPAVGVPKFCRKTEGSSPVAQQPFGEVSASRESARGQRALVITSSNETCWTGMVLVATLIRTDIRCLASPLRKRGRTKIVPHSTARDVPEVVPTDRCSALSRPRDSHPADGMRRRCRIKSLGIRKWNPSNDLPCPKEPNPRSKLRKHWPSCNSGRFCILW